MIEENNFPTVRQGSQTLLACVVAVVVRMLALGATDGLNAALAALLTALGATHASLVAGKVAISSKWAADAPVPVTTTTTTTKQVIPATTLAPAGESVKSVEMTVQGDVNVAAQ